MFFDARKAKALKPGDHLVIDGCQGLRLVASASKKTWTYRYKAEDGRMKQVAIGQWPVMSIQAAAAQWQKLREDRDSGADPVSQRKTEKKKLLESVVDSYSVRNLVEDFIAGHLELRTCSRS